MADALWLTVSLAVWYFQALLNPLSGAYLTAIPALGAVCLLLGAAGGLRARHRPLFWFALPVAVSHLFAAIAGALRGSFASHPDGPLWLFLVLQLAALGFAVWRARRAPWPAIALAVFCITYAFFAAFLAAMSFRDVWM